MGSHLGQEVHAITLFYWVATLDKLFIHIASPVFSAPWNWSTNKKGVFGLDCFNGLTEFD